MGTKRRIVTVNIDLDVNFVDDGAADMLTQNQGGAYVEARVGAAVRLGDSTYSAIQSAIYFLYWQSGIERPEKLKGGIIMY